jgi:hypothetical protein
MVNLGSHHRIASAVVLLITATAGPLFGQFRGDWRTDFSKHTVPLEEIVSGGPPKDGIPAIDNPKFVSVREADQWLDSREPVVVVNLDGVAKAYPIQILIWHEIVNDVVGQTPVTVTFCPLCNTALAFDRRFDGRLLDFGTTGRLRLSDLVMYDRQTETWWQQATGEGIVGEHAGRVLEFLSAPLLSWKTFKATFPEGHVLSRDTGFQRAYGQNPYVGYDRQRSPFPNFFKRQVDGRLSAMERVVAIDLNGESAAFPFSSLRDSRVANDEVGDVPVAVFWVQGTSSPLDARQISRGRDVGSTAVFDRRLDGRVLTFKAAEVGLFTDRETGSQWDILGRAVAGPLAGKQLEPVVHGNHFWFAWGVFKPETRVVQ